MESISLKIIRTDQQSRKFIVEFNGSQWPVKQVPEQYDENPPEFLDCVVKASTFGTFIEQNYISLIKKHYDVGQEQVFDIVRVSKDSYELVDAWGYTAYAERVFNIDTNLNPKVRCRISSIEGKHPTVEILEALPIDTAGLVVLMPEIKKVLNIDNDDYDDVLDLLIQDVSGESFDLKCMGWFSRSLDEIRESVELLDTVVEFCRILLEDSDFLSGLEKKKRSILVNRTVAIIENVEYFRSAQEMISNGSVASYIADTFKKLKVSGYLYHPRDKFHIVMYLFLLDPVLLEKNAVMMFDTIRSKEMEFWQDEKLSAEWIALFEYVARRLNQSASFTNQYERKSTLVQVLCLQQVLADDIAVSMFDSKLNRSMLFRYASEMEVQKPKQMLDLAYRNLVGVVESPITSDVKKYADTKLLSNILFNQYADTENSQLVPLEFKGETAVVQIKEDGITILPRDADYSSTENAMATSMNLWRNLQVRVPNRIKSKKTDSISKTIAIWSDIDTQLFNREVPKNSTKIGKSYYTNGDDVKFIVRRQIGETTFACDILDHGISAHAIIDTEDIVKYRLAGVSVKAFKVENGYSKVLRGTVKSYDADGNYRITMSNMVNSEVARRHKIDWETDKDYTLLCRLYHYNEDVGRYIGVDECGIPVSVKVIDEDEPWSNFAKGNIIEAGYSEKATSNGFIQCEFISVSDERLPSVIDCFSELMTLCCGDQYYPTEDEAKGGDECIFKPMHPDHLAELISIIEREATLENDYLKAYNYYGICRVMSKILGSEDRSDYYENRLQLIRLLYRFNDTGNVDPNELNKLENENASVFSQHTQLHYTLYQLKLVSCLNKPDLFSYLSQMRNTVGDKELVRLANLVMAHTLLKSEGVDKEAESIYSQILDLLKLQRKETNKKYYGEETQIVEFKPSMVFPPEENMQPNIVKQTHEILEQICAFLNCGGGTLYIGVSNNGYERGLDQDLQYSSFQGSKDKYTLHLDNNIHNKLGAVASRYVQRRWDDDIEGDVLIVEVQDCSEVVSLDGEYYERRGTSVRPAPDKSAFKKFKEQQIESKKISKVTPVAVPNDLKTAEAEKAVAKPLGETILTSALRNNVLHDYEPEYQSDIAGYICLLDNGKYRYQQDEVWENHSLTLAIHDSEKRGYLVCVYEDGYVCKVSMEEILGRTEGADYSRCVERKLLFACPATKNDSLMLILKNSKGDKYIRFDEVKSLAEGKMSECGVVPTEAPFAELVQYEIVPTEKIIEFKLLGGKKQLGSILKNGEGKKAMGKMESLGVMIFK